MSKRGKKPRLKRHGIMKRWSSNGNPNKDLIREYASHTLTLGQPEPPDISTQAANAHRHRLFQSIRRQGVENFIPQKMHDTRLERVVMFFSGNTFFFTIWNKKRNIARKSIDYYGRELALRAYNGGGGNGERILYPPENSIPAPINKPDYNRIPENPVAIKRYSSTMD